MVDVLAADRAWEVPAEWVAGVRARLREWGDDPKALRPPQAGAFPDFVDGTPAAVWFTHQVAPLLSGWIPVLHGEYADLGAVLAGEFYRPAVRIGGAGYVVRVAPTDWPLQVVSGARGFPEEGRRQALELSREVVSLFVDAPPMRARARALVAGFDRVLADREATRMHVAADYETIAQFWRTTVLSERERTVLPELAGPASALRYSLDALRDAHAKLTAVIADDDGTDFTQLLARLIRVAGLATQPAAVGQILGIAGWDVEHALADLRKGFDPHVWLAGNTAWLGQAVALGNEGLAREWAAAATRVSVHLAGVLEKGVWPDPEVPDLGAFFRLLENSGPGEAGGVAQDQAAPVQLVWGSGRADGTAERLQETGPADEQAAAAIEAALAEAADVPPADPKTEVATGEAGPAVMPADVPAEPKAATDEAAGSEPATATGADDGSASYELDALAELDALIGLESVKEAVRRMVAEIRTNQRRKDFGLPTQDRARHMVFVGKPGTAKTTIARLLGRIYHQLGVLEKGHVVEVDRSDLVGPSVGTTAPLTAAKFREALGGVLFVDEAYTLVPENMPGDFGLEAVATLLKMMEDHRDQCVVIVAGYHREMQRFMESNTGLASRFSKLLAFSEYDNDQLVAIFELQARQKGMLYTDGVLAKVRQVIPPAPRGHNFGNGRFIRNILEEAISNQATRLALRDPETLTERDLRQLLPEDVKPTASMRAEDYLFQKPGT
ncbi:AAA ATPase central domain protein [Kribbella flavida DSM 17836]|uniref:AAA ATPase central domain protein n=1 Tax=Kribbella flavida (strain DSM 17836 / JCM 10339 / NBRC 14399) TaxID=479435 RepID=D2PPI5_KRIFD|nr:AAA ATPase central domain protein [Kribbella flavida DSM 17836]